MRSVKKPNRRALALLLAVFLLLGTLPGVFAEEGGEPRESGEETAVLHKLPFWKADRSKLPQNVWTDVESPVYWDRIGGYFKRSGERADDLLVLARSQLGYQASMLNYSVDENGEIHNYTRYGAWYGNTYGDWCAMFAAFCLHYAGIPEDVFPRSSNCGDWVNLLRKRGLFAEREEAEPRRGDLVFFGNRYEILHMGIVSRVDEEEDLLYCIQGNDNRKVTERKVALDHGSIIGYGVLPSDSTRRAETPLLRIRRAAESAFAGLAEP